MKYFIILVLIFSGCTLQYTHKIDSDNIENKYKYKFYSSLVNNVVPNNNYVAKQLYILSNSTITPLYNIDNDNTWFQGFYGSYLALDKNNEFTSKKYVKYIKDFLYRSKGVLLRDFNDETLKSYQNGNTKLEASKDQLLGIITSLFMIYYYNDNDPFLRLDIYEIIMILKTQMGDYFLLFNNKTGKFYDSAWYGVVHYYGLNSAVQYICTDKYKTSTTKSLFKTILFESLRRKIEMIELGKKTYYEAISEEVDISSLNIKKEIDQLEKEVGVSLKDIFKKDEFSINLQFYEMLIVGTIGKNEAKDMIKLLEFESVMKLKHLNLASLYIYFIKKWGLSYNKNVMGFYKEVITRDNYLYHSKICPNSKKIGSDWTIDGVNGFLPNKFSLLFPEDWDKEIYTDKDFEYLKGFSDAVHLEIGIPFLSRQVIVNLK